MTYELALKLKNAGFPQTSSLFVWAIGGDKCEDEFTYLLREDDSWSANEIINAPTLSELIEECGEEFCILQTKITDNPNEKYRAGTFDGVGVCYGSTPEEAVAKLWLALNKK